MKIKQLLGMLTLDANANEIGKIIDAEFDTETGKVSKIVISLKKNLISSDELEVDYTDVKSIGDYVLLAIEVDKATAIEEAEKAKKAAKEAEKAAKEEPKELEEAEEVEVVEAEVVEEEASTDVDIE